MAIDYLTKWMEAETNAKIIEARVKDFIWKSIIYHFSLSRVIIIDNDQQLNGFKLSKFYKDLGIMHCFTFVR